MIEARSASAIPKPHRVATLRSDARTLCVLWPLLALLCACGDDAISDPGAWMLCALPGFVLLARDAAAALIRRATSFAAQTCGLAAAAVSATLTWRLLAILDDGASTPGAYAAPGSLAVLLLIALLGMPGATTVVRSSTRFVLLTGMSMLTLLVAMLLQSSQLSPEPALLFVLFCVLAALLVRMLQAVTPNDLHTLPATLTTPPALPERSQ